MPHAPRRPCSWPGCHALTDDGRCAEHKRQGRKDSDGRRGSSASRGYGFRWQKAREAYLGRHPLCAQCLALGRIVPATVVDHIVPHKGDHELFWDSGNWQVLCKPCHDRKTGAEGRAAGIGY
jgi:5-methylcytosine-specific restriction enzyme A